MRENMSATCPPDHNGYGGLRILRGTVRYEYDDRGEQTLEHLLIDEALHVCPECKATLPYSADELHDLNYPPKSGAEVTT